MTHAFPTRRPSDLLRFGAASGKSLPEIGRIFPSGRMQRKFKARQDSAVGRVFMKTTHGFRAAVNVVGVVAGMAALSGCMGSPTYGTDKSASEQLMQDLGQSVSITGDQDTRKLKYNPRPELVVVSAEDRSLPPPQTSLANRENNPAWVE